MLRPQVLLSEGELSDSEDNGVEGSGNSGGSISTLTRKRSSHRLPPQRQTAPGRGGGGGGDTGRCTSWLHVIQLLLSTSADGPPAAESYAA